MNTLLASSASSSTFTISAPTWILWGFGIAVIITLALFLSAFVFSVAFESMTMGWLSGDNPLHGFKQVTLAFVTYGLIPGLGGSFIGSTCGHGWGWFAGVVLMVVVALCHNRYDNRKRFGY